MGSVMEMPPRIAAIRVRAARQATLLAPLSCHLGLLLALCLAALPFALLPLAHHFPFFGGQYGPFLVCQPS
jgi:hypothetical protein